MRVHRAREPRALKLAVSIAAAIALTGAGAGLAQAQSSNTDEVVNSDGVAQKLDLTAAQRNAIYRAARNDKSKTAPSRFPTNVGADVPPMIELYALPDDVAAANPTAKLYKFTRVEDQVVLVDPTRMQVVAVIGPDGR